MAQGKWSKAPTYKKVAVLLLCWEKKSSDMYTEKEIGELDTIFKEKFGYHTEVARLDATNPNTRVQMQVNARVASFAEKHDGPDNLLIVYYAGHGASHDVFGLILHGWVRLERVIRVKTDIRALPLGKHRQTIKSVQNNARRIALSGQRPRIS